MAEQIDLNKAITTMKRFITGQLLQSSLDGYVVGLSGGIDSAVATALAVEAVGPEKVLAVMMPFRTSNPDSVDDAKKLIGQLGIAFRHVDITPMIDAYFEKITPDIGVRAGNKMARERMSILFDIAHETHRLVLGTGNRTEIALGYTTWYGDAACSMNPIGQLYKSDVREIAQMLDIPESIRRKPPSADLWAGQTDEDEIGVRYEHIDGMLRRILDDGVASMSTLTSEGYAQTDISRVISLINRNEFKRRMPDIAPLGRGEIPQRIQIQE